MDIKCEHSNPVSSVAVYACHEWTFLRSIWQNGHIQKKFCNAEKCNCGQKIVLGLNCAQKFSSVQNWAQIFNSFYQRCTNIQYFGGNMWNLQKFQNAAKRKQPECKYANCLKMCRQWAKNKQVKIIPLMCIKRKTDTMYEVQNLQKYESHFLSRENFLKMWQ